MIKLEYTILVYKIAPSSSCDKPTALKRSIIFLDLWVSAKIKNAALANFMDEPLSRQGPVLQKTRLYAAYNGSRLSY